MGILLGLSRRVLSVALLSVVGFGCQAHDGPAAEAVQSTPPASVTYKDLRGGKPTERFYTLQFDLVNRRDEPIWFIMRSSGDTPLPTTDRFVVQPEDTLEFGDEVLSRRERSDPAHWGDAKSRAIQCFGADFMALRLPGHGELHIDDFQVSAFSPVHDFEIWEASDVLVDDKTPLETWLASRVHAPEGYYATLTDKNRNPSAPTQILDGADIQPLDTVHSVQVRILGRWTLPIIDLPAEQPDPWR